MFKETMQSTQIQPFREVHPGEEVHSLSVGEEHFGFLYVAPWASTLIWHGTLDFSRVETEALAELSFHISGRQDRLYPDEPRARNATSVYLAFANESDLECDLKKPEDFQQYQEALQDFNQISFIRYDVRDTSVATPLEYSFTATNPHWLPSTTDPGQLAIKLPLSRPWSASVLQWATKHHVAFASFHDKVDLQATGDILSALSHSAKS